MHVPRSSECIYLHCQPIRNTFVVVRPPTVTMSGFLRTYTWNDHRLHNCFPSPCLHKTNGSNSTAFTSAAERKREGMEFGAACDCGDLEAVKACMVAGLVRASGKGHAGVVAFLLSCTELDVNGANVCTTRVHNPAVVHVRESTSLQSSCLHCRMSETRHWSWLLTRAVTLLCQRCCHTLQST